MPNQERLNRLDAVLTYLIDNDNVADARRYGTKKEKVKPIGFNLSYWGDKTDCGTTACAAGWCGLEDGFRRQGFCTDIKDNDVVFNKNEYDKFDGYDAVVVFFDLGHDIARQIFSSELYSTFQPTPM